MYMEFQGLEEGREGGREAGKEEGDGEGRGMREWKREREGGGGVERGERRKEMWEEREGT